MVELLTTHIFFLFLLGGATAEDCDEVVLENFSHHQHNINGKYKATGASSNGRLIFDNGKLLLFFNEDEEKWVVSPELNAGLNAFVKDAAQHPTEIVGQWSEWDGEKFTSEDRKIPITCYDVSSESEIGDEVLQLNDELWQRVERNPSLVMFSAPWCGHCKRMHPIWQNLAKQMQGRTIIGQVDCTVNDKIRSRYHVQSFPTIKLFNRGRIVEYSGHRSQSGFMEFLKEHNAFSDAVDTREEVELLTYEWRLGSEVVRLFLREMGIKYREKKYIKESWEMELDPDSETQGTGVLPVLNIGKLSLSHESAIVRYLAREHKLEGKTTEFKAYVDTIIQHCDDFYAEMTDLLDITDALTFEKAKGELRKDLIKWVKYINDQITKNNMKWQETRTMYIVGPGFTVADLYVFDVLSIIKGLDSTIIRSYQYVRNYFIGIGVRDNLGLYLASQDEQTHNSRPAYLSEPNARHGNKNYPEHNEANPFRNQ